MTKRKHTPCAECATRGCGFCTASTPIVVRPGDVFADVDTKGRTIRVETVAGERAAVVVKGPDYSFAADYPTHVFGFPWYARVAAEVQAS